eukprot:1315698-Amorphochlora_amoeboformis.AAC.1
MRVAYGIETEGQETRERKERGEKAERKGNEERRREGENYRRCSVVVHRLKHLRCSDHELLS